MLAFLDPKGRMLTGLFVLDARRRVYPLCEGNMKLVTERFSDAQVGVRIERGWVAGAQVAFAPANNDFVYNPVWG